MTMKTASPGQEEDPEHDEAHDAEAEGAVEVGPGALETPPPAPAPATQPVPAMGIIEKIQQRFPISYPQH